MSIVTHFYPYVKADTAVRRHYIRCSRLTYLPVYGIIEDVFIREPEIS